MASKHRGIRAWIGMVAATAATATAVTLVPAIAQEPGGPAPEPYVELRSGLSSADQYIRLVDGDPATSDPQQGFTGLNPWTLAGDPQLLTVTPDADPQAVLAGTGCLDAEGTPIGALPPVTAGHYTEPPLGWIAPFPMIGVTSYTCDEHEAPEIVPQDARVFITPGETLEIGRGEDLPIDFRRVKLSIRADDRSAVRLTARLEGSVVGTIDVDMDVDCVDSADWANEDSLCATRGRPFFRGLWIRYLNLDFGGPFDSLEMTATAGGVRLMAKHPSKFFLDGEVFGGTIGGDTGETAISEPPTDTLPGYEVACADAAAPPPEGPCGGKDVTLSISRYLADIDDDGNVEQVLDVVPTGAAEEVALLTLTVEWAPEDAPVGAIPLSFFDEDDDGPDDDDPAAWCSVDPPGPPGDAWCLAAFDSASAGTGQIQVTETFQGTGDPRPAR